MREYEEVKIKEISMSKVKKYRDFSITTLAMEPLSFTPKGGFYIYIHWD